MMAYDGVGDNEVIKVGFQRAEIIIDWIETRTARLTPVKHCYVAKPGDSVSSRLYL